MKCTTLIDKNREEEVIIYAHVRSSLVDEIESLTTTNSHEFIAYKDKSIIKLLPSEIFAFIVEDNKIVAITETEKLQIKQRLYEIEKLTNNSFVKINQSCLVSIKKIKKFEASFGGALLVILKNGYKDYVSRRQLKTVKERIGL